MHFSQLAPHRDGFRLRRARVALRLCGASVSRLKKALCRVFRLRTLWILLALLVLAGAGLFGFGMHMPGSSHAGPLPALGAPGRQLAGELRRDVEKLAVEIGERNVDHPKALGLAADYVFEQLSETGLFVERQTFTVRGVPCQNILAHAPGPAPSVFVVGAHYDSAQGTPGADDNASGTAALLALARRFAKKPRQRSLVFAVFVNEEPPWFKTEQMGSVHVARLLSERKVSLSGMMSLETLGYYQDGSGSQKYPAPLSLFYPNRGDFVAFVGDMRSRDLVRSSIGVFRQTTAFPSEGGSLLGSLPGVSWSDHWAFWQHDVPAIMVTDTAPFRNPHYHEASDTIDQLDFDRLSRVVHGLERVVDAQLVDR